MARKNKNSDDEQLDAQNLERVIALLEPSEEGKKPITKKEACEILKISYNTTRLGKLIEDYKAKKQREYDRRKALRGKPATPADISYTIKEYLTGSPVKDIADSLYRGIAFVEGILDKYNVPRRARSYSYDKPELIPEGAMSSKFEIGEVVYSVRYDSIAIIDAFHDSADTSRYPSGRVYRLWLPSEKWQQFAYQPSWELASLSHLKELGVSFA
jgi:hypothetical protein